MHTIFILLLPGIVLAYHILCPDRSHSQLRSHALCTRRDNINSVYTCLEDVNQPSLTFIESCSEVEDFVRPGKRYVIEGQSTIGNCSTDRYQPIPFNKTFGPTCMYVTSTCTDVGQLISTKGSCISDTTCICDYTEGYAYVTTPADVCNCVPSVEDCTCYEKLCPENRLLSGDYECFHRNVIIVTKCASLDKSGNNLTSTTTTTMITDSTAFNESPTRIKNADYVATVMTVIILILSGVIIGVLYLFNDRDIVTHQESVKMELSRMMSHIEVLQSKLELPKRHLIEIEQKIFSENSLVQLDSCKAELISINNELKNVWQMQGNSLQHDDDAKMNGSQGSTGIRHTPEKTLQGSSNNSILPNILTDVAANNIFEDGCEIELKNTINVNNESQYKFPRFEASETQELVDNDIINIEDPDDAQFKSFDSQHLTHSIVRHLSRNETEVLPEITIRTIDGKIKHIKERYITMDAGGKLYETKDKISEKSSEMTLACIPASTFDESTEKSGESSKISFKDILRIKMTKQGWKGLCQDEARKGRKITLKELPQVCAPDTILLLDISGSTKGNAYKELKDAAYHFINKRSETRTELKQDENIAMVTFGHKTEVRHHLTSDYSVVENHLERLPEPGGPSPLVVGLKLCKSVIDARGKISMIGSKRIGRKIVGGSRFHPRIILISDGNITPTECVVGNKNLPDLNTSNEQEMSEMIDELYDICTEFKNTKVHIDCIPVGCYDETRLKFISECTGGKLLEKERAATLGNERLKMVYAKQIEEGKLTEDELKSKLLSMKAITADDFDEITDMAKNPTKYGVANNDDSDSDDDSVEEGAEGVNIANLLEFLLLAADDDLWQEDADTPHFS